MKKLLLIGASILSLHGMSQNWVSTTPQNRRVVIEEFTGIHCGYCPDGHRIANDLVKANPDKVFLINIHAGGYATPGTGEPDFRTTAGTAIDGAAGVTGYPSGSVSRSATPWGQSRDKWASTAATLLGQTSPVNVAVKASVDFATRTLTTEVEVYYTANSPATSNFLTIALTQDDVLGPQSDYGDYNPTNWVNGQYRHNHVLRQLITSGNFGEKLDSTRQGNYFYKKYTTVIPDNYINTKAVLNKFNVVAFVSQANNNILSGAEAEVEFDNNLKTDLSVVDKTTKPDMCATSVSPKVEVTNLLDQPVSAFSITATVNGTPVTKNITQTLAKNEKVTVTWDNINVTTTGAYQVNIGGIDNVMGTSNNKLYDMELANDAVTIKAMSFKAATVNSANLWCGFESMTNTVLDLSENPNASVPTTGNYGSSSTRALRVSLHSSWGVEGKPVHVLFGKADLSAITGPGLSYYYAYSDGSEGGTKPTVKVSISKDCGVTWTEANSIQPDETGQPASAGTFYVPTNTQYKMVTVNLDAYKNDNIIAKISVIPGSSGNSFYLDGLSITSFGKLGILNKASDLSFDLYPNPSQGSASLTLPTFKAASYIIRDVTGKEFQRGDLMPTENLIDLTTLTNGVYFVEVIADGKTAMQKLILAK
jgi:hypothetical protein